MIETERTISISEAQSKITRLPEQFEEDPKAVTVTRHGKPVMAILPYKEYRELVEKIDSLLETLEIMQDEELMAAFREGVKALERGETVAWEDAKKRLGVE
jgi:antitoxin YefM